MDGARFDTLTRFLTEARSRRGTLVALLGGTLSLVGLAETSAKKKKHKKKRQRPVSPPPQSPPSSPSCPEGQRLCRGTCLSVLICCTDDDCAGGRTCQAGTCACPLAKPHICPGSTLCQQCCVTADCTDTTSGAGLPTCTNGTCTCVTGTYCPLGSGGGLGSPNGLCGECCDNAECPNGGQTCTRTSPSQTPACRCNLAQIACSATGRTGCIFNSAECRNACGQACNPQNGDAACPCSTDLVCDFEPGVQDGYFCRARSAG